MKLLTNFFGSAATKRPIVTILVVLLLTGFFGYMSSQAEELSTSFGGELDTPEIQAQSKLGDYFASSGGQSVFQVIITGDDVLTVDGYKAWLEIQQVVATSEISEYLVSQPGQGALQGFFGPIDFARAKIIIIFVSVMVVLSIVMSAWQFSLGVTTVATAILTVGLLMAIVLLTLKWMTSFFIPGRLA